MAEGRSAKLEVLALSIIEQLRTQGHQAFLVGGCVRDRLLGLAPSDFDIGTDARPQQIQSYFRDSQPVGAHFGVILVKGNEGLHVEVATFRSEGAYRDGRHPERVQFEMDAALDAKRRDFTINALFEDPFSGTILDYVGGQADLKKSCIRAIGDPHERFAEDHLRMLRAVRFAARLHFELEAETKVAIQSDPGAICRISTERIRDELVKILTEGNARRGFELLDECRLLAVLLPEVKAFQGVQQPPEYHPEGDVWQHVLMMLNWLSHPTPTLALGVLLHDVGKPPTFSVADRIRFNGHAEIGAEMARKRLVQLKFSNSEVEQVTCLVAQHMKFKDLLSMRQSTLKRFLRLPNFEELLELHRLDCLASNGRTDSYDFAQHKLGELSEEVLKPPRLVTGRDLIEAGHKPGPVFGEALEVVETAQLEGNVQNREQAFALAESVLAERTR